MTEQLDQQTIRWLNSLKINKTFTSITDFENGYNFGLVFDKLQLSRGKKFKNNSDMGCIFQNYKNVRDILLEHFNYDFPVNNIIYRTSDLLKTIKQLTSQYIEQKKIMAMKAATSISSGFENQTLIHPQQQKQFKNRQKQINSSAILFNQTSKMPKKIQDIQKKLDKYRQQKTRHQLFALQQRKQQIQQYRRVVMNNRDYQINKVKRVHDQTKDKEKKVFDVWYKTQQIKKQRIQTDKQFQSFQRQKRNKLLQTLRKDQVDTINKGLEMFQLNCIRQGIDLQPDPTRALKPQGQFNKVVVLERIKDNLNKHEIDKKQRIKRQNKKRVDAEQAKYQSQLLWTQLNKIDDYSKKFSAHFGLCENSYKIQKRMQAQQQTRKQKLSNKKFVDLPAYQDQQKRQQQFRRRKVQYLHNDVRFMQTRWKKQQQMVQEVIQALLQATIQGQQKFQKNQGFSYGQWKNLQDRFLNYQDKRKKGKKDTKLYIDFSSFDLMLREYLKGQGSWKNYHVQSKLHQENNNQLFTKSIQQIVRKSYPDLKAPETQKIPLYMPLKIIFNGPKLSGKTSHSAKLAQKYGVIIINPKQIIKQAIDLAKPPVEQDPKKGAKKQTKKVQQPTAQKLALKQFGIKLLQKINTLQQATTQQYLQAIKFKVSQNFKHKNQNQIYQQYQTAKQKQKLKYEQTLKQFQQAQKKPKKDSKKGGNQPASDQPPKQNICFYSNGFVIDDFPQNQHSIKLLQKQLNCYISDEQRINKDAVQAKRQMKLVLQIPQPPIDNSLKQGTFDLFLSLSVDEDSLIKRKTGRKIDPQTKIIYHPTFNPIPDIKGFADKLVQLPAPQDENIKSSQNKYIQQKQKLHKFYSVFGIQNYKVPAYSQIKQGQEAVQQTFAQLSSLIQNLLQAKYKNIESIAQKVKNKPVDNIQPKNQPKQGDQQQNQVVQNKIIEAPPLSLSQIIAQKINTEDSKYVLNMYLKSVKKYQQQIKQCLFSLDGQRNNFMKQLLNIQKNFTSIINRPDDKAGKILGFQQNYNKLLAEQGNVVKDIEASKHLIQRLNQLYDSLWQAIGSKKNQAVQERSKFKNSNWLNTQSTKVVQILKNLLQIQLNYLCETIFTILILSCKIQQKPSDYMTQYLSLGIAPELQPILAVQPDLNNLTTNQRLAYYITQTNKCIQSLPAWIQQKYKKMKIQKIPTVDKLVNQFVQFCKLTIQKRQQNIINKVNQRVLQQRSYFQTLVNKMDDWIIQGIKAQNDFVYDIYKNVKKCIEQARKSNVKQLHVRQITQILYPIKQLTLNSIPLRIQTYHRKLPIYSYMIFLQQIKTLANNQGKINFEIFKKYMQKRKKSKLLHELILKIDYDTTQQYLVKDGYLYMKQLALAVILWDVNVFDDDQLARYKSKLLQQQLTHEQKSYKSNKLSLSGQSNQQLQQSQSQSLNLKPNQQPYKKKASVISAFPTQRKIKLHELVLMDGAFDQQEQYIIRHFIFEVFRESRNDYVQAQELLDTLSIFDQIQVLRYGDTVMMLNV